MTRILTVVGLNSGASELLLRDILGFLRGVHKVSVDRLKGIVCVEVADEQVLEKVKDEIKRQGYGVF